MKNQIIERLSVLLLELENHYPKLSPGELGEMNKSTYENYKNNQSKINQLRNELSWLEKLSDKNE